MDWAWRASPVDRLFQVWNSIISIDKDDDGIDEYDDILSEGKMESLKNDLEHANE